MNNYFKLVRPKNLLFIAFLQFVMSQVVLTPILQTFGFDATKMNSMLYLLIVATILIAAGGYVLNEYFDIKIDIINRPEKQIVGKQVSKHSAMLFHQILTGLGVISGLIVSYFARSFTIVFIFIVVPGLLWFYSASYKRQFILGNLVMAFCGALSVLVVGITKLAFLQKEYGSFIFETPIPRQFMGWMGGFALFSFLSTWIREIIKDLEDEKGDREMECHTMPIKWGIKKTKFFLYSLIVFTVIGLFLVNGFLIPFSGNISFRYIIFGLVLPFAVLCYLIFIANTPADFHQASTFTKFIMLIGVMYGFVFYFLQAKTFGITIFEIFKIK